VSRSLEEPVDGVDHDVATWSTLTDDIGLGGLGLAESVGGVGGLVEVLAVAEELGSQLAAVPFLSSTVLAGQVLSRCGAGATAALEAIATGTIASVVFTDRSGRPAPQGVARIVSGQGDDILIEGGAPFVVDGASAQLLVVAIASGEGLDLVLVDATAPGVTRRAMRVLDFSRPQAEITFAATPARRLTHDGEGAAALRAGLDIALLALAAEQLGGAQAAFDRTLDYVKIRRQFNREIGSFQAIKHRLAEALALVEQARSAVVRSTWDDLDDATLAEAAAVAAAWCSEAFLAVTAEMVQMHGGIGFTWEHDAHLYFRRARADAVLWGDATYHRERLAILRGW
jgi:alkylation response protein AidB-like acyl-CoA dehydrogenase